MPQRFDRETDQHPTGCPIAIPGSDHFAILQQGLQYLRRLFNRHRRHEKGLAKKPRCRPHVGLRSRRQLGIKRSDAMRLSKTTRPNSSLFPEDRCPTPPPMALINARISRSESPRNPASCAVFQSQAVRTVRFSQRSDGGVVESGERRLRHAAVTVTGPQDSIFDQRELILQGRTPPGVLIRSIHDRALPIEEAIVDFHPNLCSFISICFGNGSEPFDEGSKSATGLPAKEQTTNDQNSTDSFFNSRLPLSRH